MMEKDGLKTVSLLVENKPGVLFRVVSHFKRRNYNIESIAVGPTEDKTVSRIVITMVADRKSLNSFVRLLRRTIDVLEVKTVEEDEVVARELALVRISAGDQNVREQAMALAKSRGAKVVESTETTVVLEISDTFERVEDFINSVSGFNVSGISRTGVTVIEKQ
ncbi:MAG: acetolactate synthase small subunit [Nitrososphaeria archaeon]